jgi:hypothetical protein
MSNRAAPPPVGTADEMTAQRNLRFRFGLSKIFMTLLKIGFDLFYESTLCERHGATQRISLTETVSSEASSFERIQ